MAYDINAVKRKIAELQAQNKKRSSKKSSSKIHYFKPTMGKQEVRFLPYEHDDQGQPFQQIDYYDSRQLSEKRIPAPKQWGLPDPVADLVEELEKDRASDTTWKLMKELRLKESNYALVFVRGQEEKGVQIWELNQTVLGQIYGILAHPDYEDEDLFDPEKGYDFTITCGDSGKTTMFGGKEYVVKTYDCQPRRKSSLLADTKEEREELLASVPNLSENFKRWVLEEEKLKEMVMNFLNAGKTDENDTGSEEALEKATPPATEVETAAASKIDEAFGDLDDDDN
jgi:hypothetical protein